MAFRSNPGVDVTTHVLQDRAIVVTIEELRFSRADTRRFFAGNLSPGQLATVEERALGWPFALMVYRNTGVAEAGGSVADAAQLAAKLHRRESASRPVTGGPARACSIWRCSTGSRRTWWTTCWGRVTPVCGSAGCRH